MLFAQFNRVLFPVTVFVHCDPQLTLVSVLIRTKQKDKPRMRNQNIVKTRSEILPSGNAVVSA